MARTKTPDAARSAAHAGPGPAPVPGAGPAAGSPAAAVCAALAANPGATVAVIAAAAGTGRPAARDALLAMETAGTATRTRGGKPGVPDTWTLAAGEAGTARDDESPDGRDPGGMGGAGPDDGTTQDAGEPGVGQQAAGGEEATAGLEPGPGLDGGAVPDDGPQGQDAGTQAGGGTGDAPDPAITAEVAGCLTQIGAAGSAAAAVLAGGGDLRAVLAGLDEIAEQAAQARRALKAALGGRKAPAARPGGLREKVLAHLRAFPGSDFTPHEIHKVLGNSSGAIANALDTLVRHGDAEVASDKPRRFRLAPAAVPAAPSPAPARDSGTGDEENGGTELAGAA